MRADKCKGEGGLRPFVRTQGPCFPTNLNVSFSSRDYHLGSVHLKDELSFWDEIFRPGGKNQT